MNPIQIDQKFTNGQISVVGVSVKEGQKLTGVEKSPCLFREAGLLKALEEIGWQIFDTGDITKEGMIEDIELEMQNSKRYKYSDLENIETIGVMNRKLHQIIKHRSNKKDFVLTLGGDHGLATGSISGMQQTYDNLKVIWFDAHGDCNTPEISPSGNYHGMPVAHLLGWMKEGEVKSFDWLKPSLKPENIVFIGLRDLDKGEKELLKLHKIKVYTPFDIEDKGGIANVMNEALQYLKCDTEHNNPIHVSFDVDGCDPSFITATGTKARCGLTERECHYMLQRIARTGNLVSLDIVEINNELEADKDKKREVLHGDNKLIEGPPSLVYACEFVLSALGNSWL